jgi:HEAT repeat protein
MGEEFKAKLQPIVEKLAPENRPLAQKDIDALLQAGAESTDHLFLIVRNQRLDPNLRETACWVLARLGGHEAEQVLLDVLSDRSPVLRRAAARSLGELGGDAAAQPLITAMMEDADAEVRTSAAYALGLLGDKQAVAPMITKLSDQAESARVRGTIAEALADLKDRAAVIPLIGALKDQAVEVRFWAAFALGELGDLRALPELERLAGTDHSVMPGYGAVSDEAADAIQNIQARAKNRDR